MTGSESGHLEDTVDLSSAAVSSILNSNEIRPEDKSGDKIDEKGDGDSKATLETLRSPTATVLSLSSYLGKGFVSLIASDDADGLTELLKAEFPSLSDSGDETLEKIASELLIVAAYGGATNCIQRLMQLNIGAKALGKDRSTGKTALHYAAKRGDAMNAQLLLELGASESLFKFDHRGYTPLDLALYAFSSKLQNALKQDFPILEGETATGTNDQQPHLDRLPDLLNAVASHKSLFELIQILSDAMYSKAAPIDEECGKEQFKDREGQHVDTSVAESMGLHIDDANMANMIISEVVFKCVGKGNLIGLIIMLLTLGKKVDQLSSSTHESVLVCLLRLPPRLPLRTHMLVATLHARPSSILASTVRSGRDPLSEALKRDFPEAALILLHHGAPADSKDQRGNTCLHWLAGQPGYGRKLNGVIASTIVTREPALALAANDNGLTPVHLAAQVGNLAVLDALLKGHLGKAAASVSSANGSTPLHVAIERGNLDASQLLLDRGANMDARDASGQSPRDMVDALPPNHPIKLQLLFGDEENGNGSKIGGNSSSEGSTTGPIPIDRRPVQRSNSIGPSRSLSSGVGLSEGSLNHDDSSVIGMESSYQGTGTKRSMGGIERLNSWTGSVPHPVNSSLQSSSLQDSAVAAAAAAAGSSAYQPSLTKIFVGGLSASCDSDDLRAYFERFGPVKDAFVMYHQETGQPRGFGFVTFEVDEAAESALGTTFHNIRNKMVEVKRAFPKAAMQAQAEAAKALALAGAVNAARRNQPTGHPRHSSHHQSSVQSPIKQTGQPTAPMPNHSGWTHLPSNAAVNSPSHHQTGSHGHFTPAYAVQGHPQPSVPPGNNNMNMTSGRLQSHNMPPGQALQVPYSSHPQPVQQWQEISRPMSPHHPPYGQTHQINGNSISRNQQQSGIISERGSNLSSDTTEYFISADIHHQQAAMYQQSFFPGYTQSATILQQEMMAAQFNQGRATMINGSQFNPVDALEQLLLED